MLHRPSGIASDSDGSEPFCALIATYVGMSRVLALAALFLAACADPAQEACDGGTCGSPHLGDAGGSLDGSVDGPMAATHGSGNCGGGNPLDVPLCPNDARTLHQRLNAARAQYYGDGVHMFGPYQLAWDASLARVAQDYATQYAAGMAPDGAERSDVAYDSFWEGTYQGYHAIAGREAATSCDCPPPTSFIVPPARTFYNQHSALSRTYLIRIDALSRMGVGHVGTADGSHYWTFVFAP